MTLRRTPLRRFTALRSTGGPHRTWFRRRAPRDLARQRAFREHCLAAHPNCQVRGPDCTGRSTHAHHVLPRSQGGDHHPDNALGCCLHCHGYVHANPALSYAKGWLRRRGG